jgi:hypothetical protein
METGHNFRAEGVVIVFFSGGEYLYHLSILALALLV